VLCDTTYCAGHARVPYTNSTRAKRLPSNWKTLRLRILRRDRHTCYVCGQPADQVDHLNPGDDHSPHNLAAICRPCHMSKSGHEGGVTQGRFT
jgi:5-methylcytosine-specific restriction protein A